MGAATPHTGAPASLSQGTRESPDSKLQQCSSAPSDRGLPEEKGEVPAKAEGNSMCECC